MNTNQNLNTVPIYRAKQINGNEWIEGFYIQQKTFESKCLKCNSLNVKTWSEWELSYAKCNNCDFKADFHNDFFEHGHIGEIEHFIVLDDGEKHKIDPNTLAIHFPNMIDKNDTKIFASLSENCLGGDKVMPKSFVVSFEDINKIDFITCEVIGIHKG